jgi:hypothetical protein
MRAPSHPTFLYLDIVNNSPRAYIHFSYFIRFYYTEKASQNFARCASNKNSDTDERGKKSHVLPVKHVTWLRSYLPRQ